MVEAKDPRAVGDLSVQDRAEKHALEDLRRQAPLVVRMAQIADELPPYGTDSRDKKLWEVWQQEPILAGAVYSMAAKMAAMDFHLRGPRAKVEKYRRRLLAADLGVGNGWVNFVFKVAQDLLCQDNGAFIEILRAPNAKPTSQVLGIAHMDSQRCERTGDLSYPVLYKPLHGEPIPLPYYQVLPMADLPSPREEDKGRGRCAVTRVYRAAQILRNIGIYKRQKLTGKSPPALLFVQGVPRNQINASLEAAYEEQSSQGMSHYSSPVIMAAMDAGQPIDAKLVELAGLPDNYDEDQTMKWYIATLALCFGTDYTEFAPLPGGNLGSATQATEMAARARGKGPGALLQQFEFGLNFWVLPEGVEFQFASADPMAEEQRIRQRLLRAQERAMRVSSGEITSEQALEIAVYEGDAPESFLEPDTDMTEERTETVIRAMDDAFRAYDRVERIIKEHRLGQLRH